MDCSILGGLCIVTVVCLCASVLCTVYLGVGVL